MANKKKWGWVFSREREVELREGDGSFFQRASSLTIILDRPGGGNRNQKLEI